MKTLRSCYRFFNDSKNFIAVSAALFILCVALLTSCGGSDAGNPKSSSGATLRDGVPEQQFSYRDASDLSVTINSEPLFAARGSWSVGYDRAVSQNSGVIVGPGGDNPNVFAQAFDAKPGEPFSLQARAAAAVGDTAVGQFQINWTDIDGKFLGVSSRAFEIGPQERQFEYLIQAPPQAAQGTLYVAPGGASVVRYTEMRLFGGSWRQFPAVDRKTAAAARSVTNDANNDTVVSAFQKPKNLTPLDSADKALTAQESQYYFYHAVKAMHQRAQERDIDFILQVMPDYHIQKLLPVIEQLRREGIKVLAYSPQPMQPTGVDDGWFWQRADSHWREVAVRLTADELLRMHERNEVENRPFSAELARTYAADVLESTAAADSRDSH